jgi:hypothetical protein
MPFCGGDMISSKKLSRIIWTIVLVLLIVLAAYIISCKNEKIKINSSSIDVKGIYGTEVRYSDIVSVKEISELPKNGTRTNGISIGSIQVGHFFFENAGNVIIYKVKNEIPYILIETNNTKIIYGFGSDKAKEIISAFNLWKSNNK